MWKIVQHLPRLNGDVLLFGCIVICHFFLPIMTEVATTIRTYNIPDNLEFIDSDVFFEIVEPEELGYTYKIRPAKDFGAPFNESFSGFGIPLVPVDPPCGCGWPRNAEELEGSVALVERGECSFLSKTVRAEEVGARAVIVSDYDEDGDEYYVEMIDDKTFRDVNIPAGFLLGKNGFMIRKTLEKLQRRHAVINIPINLTYIPLHKMNQPPWLGW